jgi:hypothetical protein
MFLINSFDNTCEQMPTRERDTAMKHVLTLLKLSPKIQKGIAESGEFPRVFGGFDEAERISGISRHLEDADLVVLLSALKADQSFTVHPGFSAAQSFALLEKTYRVLKKTVKQIPAEAVHAENPADITCLMTGVACLSTR